MIAMEYEKFILKFDNHMLPDSFNHYFTKLDSVHKYNTKRTPRNKFFQFRISHESGKNTLHYVYLNVWKKCSTKFCHCPFSTLEKYFKSSFISNYHTEK